MNFLPILERSLAHAFSLKGPCQTGVHKLQILLVKDALLFSKHLRPECSLKARLGQSKLRIGTLKGKNRDDKATLIHVRKTVLNYKVWTIIRDHEDL